MDPNVPDSRLWTDKYHINYSIIPSFLTNEITKILQTGKAVNFIRRCCKEEDWILDQSLNLGDWANNKSDFDELKNWVNQAYLNTNKKVTEIMF